MKKLVYLAAAVVMILALCATPAFARGPWPNGEVNVWAKTVTLEYGQSLFNGPVVTGFPTGGYADVWYGSGKVRVSTPDQANALLTAPQTSNQRARLSIPYRDVNARGKLYVRHGLTIDSVTPDAGKLVVSGVVRPNTSHAVEISIQRRRFGHWSSSKHVRVKTDPDGAYTATLSVGSKSDPYQVKAYVAGDAKNAAKTVYSGQGQPSHDETGHPGKPSKSGKSHNWGSPWR